MTEYDRVITMGIDNMDDAMPTYIWWDPTHNGNFVISFDDDSADRIVGGNPNVTNLAMEGFCPRHLVSFGIMGDRDDPASFQAFNVDPTLLPVYYDADEDEMQWNTDRNVVVRIRAGIFGSQYIGHEDHHFEIDRYDDGDNYDFDTWRARFDHDGVAGRNSPTEIEELPIPVLPANPTAGETATYQALLAARAARIVEITYAHHADRFGLKNAAGDNISYRFAIDSYTELYPIVLWGPNFLDRALLRA